MKKRILFLMLAAVMVLSLFAGCGSKEEADVETPAPTTEAKAEAEPTETKVETPDPVTLKLMFFGDKPLHMDEVLDEFYSQTADTLNTTLDMEFNPTADHKQKLLLIASAGEEYDLVFDAPWMQIKTLAKDGAYQALDEYFLNDAYPGLKANFSEEYLNANKFFDQIYGIPLTQTMASSEGLGIRTDLMEKYGYDEIKTYDELQAFCDDILANEPDMVPMAVEGRVGFFRMFSPNYEASNIFEAGDFRVALSEDYKTVLGATYKGTGNYYYGDSAEVFENFPAPYNTLDAWTDQLIQYAEWNKYLEEDVLTQTDPKSLFSSGKAAILSRGYQDTTALEALEAVIGMDTDLYAFPYREEDRTQTPGQHYTTYQVWNFLCVPISSTKIDRSMAFLDWIYQSEENHDLFERGIEGVHWNAVGDNQYEIPETLESPYLFPWYELTGTPNMVKYNVALPKSAVEFLEWQSNDAKYAMSPMAGFNMDYENVKTEKASIDAIISNINTGLVNGVYADPIAEVQKANADAVKAGLETFRQETIDQVQAFLDAK
jgi:predicted small lipoprotein YifL